MIDKQEAPLCLVGAHGPMERQDGFFLFPCVSVTFPSPTDEPQWSYSDKGTIVKLWACTTCRRVQAIKDYQPEDER